MVRTVQYQYNENNKFNNFLNKVENISLSSKEHSLLLVNFQNNARKLTTKE